jgi:hypothetical protein
MIHAFINIRVKQIFRALEGLGLIRTIFLIGLLIFIGFGLFMQTASTPNSFYMTGLYLLIITLIQVKRPDKLFTEINFYNFKLIFLIEYLLLTLPLSICLIYHKQWMQAISVVVLTLLIVNLDFKLKRKSLNTSIQKLIPSDCFEWKGGVRKTFVLIVALWIIGLGTSFFVGSVPVVIFILGILPLSFYEKGEPVQMILAYEMGTSRFIMHKIKMHLALFTILSIPLIIAFLFFHPGLWYIPIAEFFIFITAHIYVILLKYAFYQPNNKSNAAQVFVSIGAIGMIIPVFIPVIWLLSIRFYFKSRENLNFYLNDYN